MIKICKKCNREFKANRKDKLFCKRNCKNEYRKYKKEKPYRMFLKVQCEQCGFIPVRLCQLDVDHIDGNHKNNNVDNLQTLCANCHRLKSFMKYSNNINFTLNV